MIRAVDGPSFRYNCICTYYFGALVLHVILRAFYYVHVHNDESIRFVKNKSVKCVCQFLTFGDFLIIM